MRKRAVHKLKWYMKTYLNVYSLAGHQAKSTPTSEKPTTSGIYVL